MTQNNLNTDNRNSEIEASKLVPITVASSEMGRTTKVVTAPIDHSEPQAA